MPFSSPLSHSYHVMSRFDSFISLHSTRCLGDFNCLLTSPFFTLLHFYLCDKNKAIINVAGHKRKVIALSLPHSLSVSLSLSVAECRVQQQLFELRKLLQQKFNCLVSRASCLVPPLCPWKLVPLPPLTVHLHYLLAVTVARLSHSFCMCCVISAQPLSDQQ